MACPVCSKTFDSILSNEFSVHVNFCLDLQEQKVFPKNNLLKNCTVNKRQKNNKECPICGKLNSTAAHIKKCGKENGIEKQNLLKLVETNEQINDYNLQFIEFKDQNINSEQTINNLFKDETEVIDIKKIPEYLIKGKSKQTKLNVIRKPRKKKEQNSTESSQIEESKEKKIETVKAFKKIFTVKVKKNPLKRVNLENIIIENYKDEFLIEKELPLSWKMASLNYETSEYFVDGFEKFSKCFSFKSEMNGFSI